MKPPRVPIIRELLTLAAAVVALGFCPDGRAESCVRWTPAEANQWYAKQLWYVGSNYIPANAINPLEMWQPETFDPSNIDKELGWAEAIGMNTVRVFLHNLLWEQGADGFKQRIDRFLQIADKHHIKVMFVLFDSCWDAFPQLGPQRPPIPGVHNSGWVQAPGQAYLKDPTKHPLLEAYVRGLIRAFAQDPRVLAWDIWNEPDSEGRPFQKPNDPKLAEALLGPAFAWARAENPTQPLTSGVNAHDHEWKVGQFSAIEQIQLDESDIITFHDYSWPEEFEKRATALQTLGRPVLCTEFMARGAGSTFDGSLPIGKRLDIGMLNWGLVDGKTQTRLPWDSWSRPYAKQDPQIWFHDVFHADGSSYRAREAALIKALSAAPKRVVPTLKE